MGKQNPKVATLLYKKSNCTLNTQSRTCSGASQILTKSGVMHMKKKLPKASYYINNGKLKRDLSIATDLCILRRYYKKKFSSYKYSMNTSEVGTINELHSDNSACGDTINENQEKVNFKIDVTSLVVENLRQLLNDWIKKYLLNNTETKQKIETVLDSILHKIERQKNSSSCAYTVDIKVDEDKCSSTNVTKNKASQRARCSKHSRQTVPVSGKRLKLISTLSIPRNIKRHINDNKSHCHTRKVRYKNVFLTVSRSSTFLLNSSSFNLLSISTKSFTKRCATYEGIEIQSSGKKQDVILLPKSSYSETIPDTSYREDRKINLDLGNKVYPNAVEPMESLVKSIFADDPANVTSTEKNLYKSKNDNCTMTGSESAFKNITSCTQCHKLHWKKENVSNEAGDTVKSNIQKKLECRRKKHKHPKIKPVRHRRNIRKTSPERTTQSLKSLNRKIKYSSNVYKKSNSCQKEKVFFKDLQLILNSFSHFVNSKNINFDVHINVTPMLTNIPESEGDAISKQIAPEVKVDSANNKKPTDKIASSPVSEPKLISLLDGAMSQLKYVINKEAVSDTTGNGVNGETSRFESNLFQPSIEIAKDVSELRAIIKDLATTTENFIKENLEHVKLNKPYDAEINHKDKTNKINSINDGSSTMSKAIQISNGEVKGQVVSGLKLKKEPKKKETHENNPRLAKKSISYNVIESESILKVTDMTSAAEKIITEKVKDKSFNCILHKSKSQLEMTVGHNKKKLIAYYCDDLKSRHFQNRNAFLSDNRRCTTCPHEEHESCHLINESNRDREREIRNKEIICLGPQQISYDNDGCKICDPGYSCSSVYIQIDDRSKKFSVRSGGVGFWEGLLYCILLWIPVVVIMWLLYVYVIKDFIQPADSAVIGKKFIRSQNLKNSTFFITLSDLGF